MDEPSTPLHAASMHRTLVSFIEAELALMLVFCTNLAWLRSFLKIALGGAAQRSECFGGKPRTMVTRAVAARDSLGCSASHTCPVRRS